jgi:hypothetical protein
MAVAARARRRYVARNQRLERDARNAHRAVVDGKVEETKRMTLRRAIDRARARLMERKKSVNQA